MPEARKAERITESLPSVYLHRIREDKKVTIGLLVIGADKPVCVTLEKPDLGNKRNISNIPEGSYKVVRRYSDKFKNHWHVLGVPNRDLILIHKGNSTKDTEGCILVGMAIGSRGDTIIRSAEAYDRLHSVMPDSFMLHITNMNDALGVTV